MGIVRKNANFCSSQTDFPWANKLSKGKKFSGTKKKRCIGFSSALNTHTHSERVHMWLSLVSVTVTVNTAAGFYFGGHVLALNTVMPTQFGAKF